MSYGGGIFLTQNKVLPGAYINFASAVKAASELSDRGYGAMGLELDWGPEKQIFTVEQEDFQEHPEQYFGYDYTSKKLKGLRDLFTNLKVGYFYRLNGGGNKATCAYGTAKYSGICGNNITVVISKNVDNMQAFDVATYYNNELMDTQTATDVASLADNDFIVWNDAASLTETAGTNMEGGTNGTAASGTDHSQFLDLLESYPINILACTSIDETVKKLYASYTKRMRDDEGSKFQCVIYNYEGDYEGIINVNTPAVDSDFGESALVYWVAGAEASCQINETVGNKVYDGEFSMKVDTKQSALKKHIEQGHFVFHQVADGEYRVLKDVNSFVSFTKHKTKDFALNQDMRVLDQIGNDVAVLFAKNYMDKSQNNPEDRTALWNDLCDYAKKLLSLHAITDFKTSDIVVEKGEGKEDVLVNFNVNPVAAMEKLYMYVYVA